MAAFFFDCKSSSVELGTCRALENPIMNDAVLAIAASDARSACKGEPDIMERIRKAMKACKNHWMETNENNQFRAAVAAAILESSGDEKDRIERSAKSLNKVGAMLNALRAGVPVDIEAMACDDNFDDMIQLMKIWNETK
jgi:hypothetical protein